MEHQVGSDFFEEKAFLLMLLFGFAVASILQVQYFIPVLYGFLGARMIGNLYVVIYWYSFLVNPMLLFVAFYRLCGQDFAERTASMMISIVLGAAFGAIGGWVGMGTLLAWTTGRQLLAALIPVASNYESLLVGDFMLAVAAMAFATVVKTWDKRLLGDEQEGKVRRPSEVSAASGVSTLSGFLVLVLCPFLFLLPFESSTAYLSVFVPAVVLIAISGISQILVGYGVYRGRRWGWVTAFLISFISLVLDVAILVVLASETSVWTIIPLVEAFSAAASLLLSSLTIALLALRKSRIYCRMVDSSFSS
jgi:hypothetical protein